MPEVEPGLKTQTAGKVVKEANNGRWKWKARKEKMR